MAEKEASQGSAAKYAQRNDPKLNYERLRKAELAQLGKNVGRLRSRNFITGLTIGGIVLGIYGYTFYSVSQEKFLDELENEAKVARANYPKTSAN